MTKARKRSSKQKRPIRAKLRAIQGGRCCYCGQDMTVWDGSSMDGPLPQTAETLEHLRRLSDGGTHAADNMALACHECNAGRGSLDWLTYKTIRSGETLS